MLCPRIDPHKICRASYEACELKLDSDTDNIPYISRASYEACELKLCPGRRAHLASSRASYEACELKLTEAAVNHRIIQVGPRMRPVN